VDTVPERISDRDERLGAIVFACLQAVEQGRPLDQHEVLALHPEFATELVEFFAARADVQQLAAPLCEAALEARRRSILDPDATEDADDRLSSPPLSAPIRSFGDYELLGVVGQGGNGVVYKARQLSLHRVVALKMILAGRLASETDRQRFRNEAEAVAELDHPHIVPIYESGDHDGNAYFSMKMVDGGSLAARIAACRARAEIGLPPRAAARLVATVARAVHYAHQHGILHRDLKPANILLARALDGADTCRSADLAAPEENALGIPFVTDFSLAKRVGGDSTLTRSGDIVGTPPYMAPEQVSGRKDAVTTATDVYGLGAILYAALAARPPFQADEVLETLRQVAEHEPEPPSRINRRVDRDLETICLKCLDKDPQRRYSSAEAVARDLERWLAGEPIQARRASARERALKWARRRPAIAALGGLVFLSAAAGLSGVVWQWRRAVSALDSAEAHLYTNRIALADRYRQAHDADRADELLDECPTGLRDWEWRYLKRRHFEDVSVHDGGSEFALSADGRFLASIFNRTIHVRDRATGRVRELQGTSDGHTAVAFSRDGRWVAVGGDDGRFGAGVVELWDTKTWSEIRSLPFQGSNPHALAFSPDSRRLAAGHDDAMVRVWDVATGNLRSLPGQRKAVRDVAWSADGRLLASASRDMTIRIWDARTYEPRATLLHQRPVFGLAFHPGSRLLASATGDELDSSRGDLTLWDVHAARVVRKAPALAAMVRKVCFSPDGRRLATAGWDRVVRIWDAATLEELLPLTGQPGLVKCISFSQDGNELVSAGDDGSIRVWNAAPLREPARHQPLRSFSDDERPIFALSLTPDGRRLIFAGEDHTARVLDVDTGRELLAYRQHSYPINALAVRPDSQAVATASYYWPNAPNADDLAIRIWDPRTGADLGQIRSHEPGVSALAFHPDGIRLASASPDGTVRLWNTRTREQLHQFLNLSCWVYTVAFSPDGNRLAAAGEDGAIHVWDVPTRQLVHVLHGHTQRVVALAFHPASILLASASVDGTVRIWSRFIPSDERLLDGARGRGLAWSPNGQHLAVSGAGGVLKVWEPSSGRRVLTLQGHADDITATAYTPDGGRLVSAGWDGAIRLWDTALDNCELWAGESRRLVGHPSHVARVALLPDGKRAISGGDDRTIRVWDIASGRELRRWVGSDYKIFALAATPDGTRVVAAGDDPDIRVWDIESGRELHSLKGRRGSVFALAVTPDGRRAISGGGFIWDGGFKGGSDLDLHLWNLDTGKEIPRPFSGHRDGIWSVAVSPDGRRAASASMDGTVRIWDLDTSAEIRRFEGHRGFWVTVAAFLPDGHRVLSGGTDCHLRLWDLDTGREIHRFDGLRGPGPIDGLAIAPDGRHALSSGIWDRHLRLWDLDTGRELYHYDVPHVGLTRGTFTHDGRQAIWATFDGALRVWDFPRQFTGEPDKNESH
jgi:WD40 repeat protein